MLVLSRGCGAVLALMAVAAGAGSVTCIESGQMAYRMSRSVLQANTHVTGHDRIKVGGERTAGLLSWRVER